MNNDNLKRGRLDNALYRIKNKYRYNAWEVAKKAGVTSSRLSGLKSGQLDPSAANCEGERITGVINELLSVDYTVEWLFQQGVA